MTNSEKFLELIRTSLMVRYSKTECYDESYAMQYTFHIMERAIEESEDLDPDLPPSESARRFLAYYFKEFRTEKDEKFKEMTLEEFGELWAENAEKYYKKKS